MVKIAVASSPPGGLSAYVAPFMGYSPYATIVTVEDSEIKDSYVISLEPQMYPFYPSPSSLYRLLGEGIDALIASEIDPQTLFTLENRGVDAARAPPNYTVERAVKDYVAGKLSKATAWPIERRAPFIPPGPLPSTPISQPPMRVRRGYPPQRPLEVPPLPPTGLPEVPRSKEDFIKSLEEQLWMLEQQKWMLEQSLKSLKRALEDLEERIASIKEKLKELKGE